MSKIPHRDLIAQELIEQMEKGTAPWTKPWTPGVVRVRPYNPITAKDYKGINSFWLAASPHEDPRWLTYKQAQSVDAQVRKGEKSRQVEFWQFTQDIPILDEQGKPVRNEEGQIQKRSMRLERPKVFYANVFNAQQIDGLAPYQAPTVPFEQVDEVEKLIKSTAVPVFHDQADRAFYQPGKDQVHLPPQAAFNIQYEYYATALHEMGHASGHDSRLSRELTGSPFGSKSYAYEELRVEMAAYMATTGLGLGHNPERHAAYLESWLAGAKEDKHYLFRAANEAETIATWLLDPAKRLELEQKAQLKRENEKRDELNPEILTDEEKQKRLIKAQEEEIERQKALKTEALAKEMLEELQLSAVEMNSNREGLSKVTNLWVPEKKQNLHPVYIQSRAMPTNNAKATNDVLLLADRIQEGTLAPELIRELPLLNLTPPEISYNKKTGMHEVSFTTFAVTEKDSLLWREKSKSKTRVEIAFMGHDQKKVQKLAQSFINATRTLEAQKVRLNGKEPVWLEITMETLVEAQAKGILFSPKERKFYAPENMPRSQYEKWLPIEKRKDQAMARPQKTKAASAERVYLQVPKDEKEEVKKHGGRWDKDRQLWHVPADKLEAAQAAGNWPVVEDNKPALQEEKELQQAATEAKELLKDPLEFVGKEPGYTRYRINEQTDLSVLTFQKQGAITGKEAEAALEKLDINQLIKTDRLDPDLLDRLTLKNEIKGKEKDDRSGAYTINGTLEGEIPVDVRFDVTGQDAEQTKGYATALLTRLQEQITRHNAPEQAARQETTKAKTPAKEDRIYLAVTYEEKEEAKSLGAQWDKQEKLWFVRKDNEAAQERFAKATDNKPKVSPVEEFADFLKSHGVIFGKDDPMMDGQFHRVAIEGDKGKKNAEYKGFNDARPAGFLKLHKGGDVIKWAATGQTMNKQEKTAFSAEMANRELERQKEKAERQEKVAKSAYGIWMNTKTWATTQNSDYLAKKEVTGKLGLKVNDQGQTLVPLRDTNGYLHNLQTITEGGKLFMKNGRKEGLFHAIGFVDPLKSERIEKDSIKTIMITEGVATGATLHNATHLPTVVAFDSGNLKSVAEAIRKEYPKAKIILAADNDYPLLDKSPHKNVGLEKAKEAAQAVGGKVIEPSFTPSEKAKELTDFNDLQVSRGKDKASKEIKELVREARAPEKAQEQQKTRTVPPAPTTKREQTQEQGMAL